MRYRPAVAAAGGGDGGGVGRNGGGGGCDGASVASSTRSVRYTGGGGSVRSTLAVEGGSEGAASLVLATREVGHRELARYYKQCFRPGGGSLVTSSPQLDRLMLQYARAGVLSPHLQMRMRQPRGRNEMTRADIQREAKGFVKQGVNNNKTANGMKHYKNQSLQY